MARWGYFDAGWMQPDRAAAEIPALEAGVWVAEQHRFLEVVGLM